MYHIIQYVTKRPKFDIANHVAYVTYATMRNIIKHIY